MDNTCFETDCIIKINGVQFESGGAFIGVDKNGKHGGYVYACDDLQHVSNWHGDVKVKAVYGSAYYSNFGDERRPVWFTWHGINFYGVWCGIGYNQLIRVREVKK